MQKPRTITQAIRQYSYLKLKQAFKLLLYDVNISLSITAEEPESEPHDLTRAILFFLQDPEHFKKFEWS